MKKKNKNKNKKRIIIFAFLVALLLFIVMYLVLNYSEPNVLNSTDKEWIQKNNGKIIDISVINDVPVYSNDGSGVVFDFLNYMEKETALSFNKVPYLRSSESFNNKYIFEFIDGSQKLSSNQLLIYKDLYVSISKNEIDIEQISDLSGQTLGILSDDSAIISYYLSSVNNIKYKMYDNDEQLFKGLENNEVNMIIVPNIMYLNNYIDGKYSINYFFDDISRNLVFTMDENRQELNTIFSKLYNNWFQENYSSTYNKTLLDYYFEKRSISDKTKADLLSKTYVYGYVENQPYEFKMAGKMEGIAIEYINRIVRLTDIDINYRKYENIDELKKDINAGNVDIYFDYINYQDSKFLKTKSVFVEKFVILSPQEKNSIVNSLESLKGQNVNILSNNYLTEYIKSNTKANVIEYNNISDLKNNNELVIVDRETYTYYKNDQFKNYVIIYDGNMSNDYTFMVKSNNESFYTLFNYFINSNSYNNYRNVAYESINGSIFDKVTFEELYLIILGIILIPIFIVIFTSMLIKNKHKLKLVKKEDRKKYIDILTSLKNRNYLNLNIDKWNQCKIYPQSIILIDLNNIKYVNDNYGREKGDNLIVKAASILVNTQLENSEIIRSDGNEFLIYMVGYNENQVDIYAKKLSKSLNDLPYGFGAAVGYSMIIDNIKTIDDAINEATIAMQSDKESYK